jgi:uncharacterized membrane protein
MNRKQPKTFNLTRATLAVIVALAAVAPAWAQRYWIEELTPASPYVWSFGGTIDEAGSVAGMSVYGNWYGHATRWDPNGVPTDLGTLPGWIAALPHGASDDGTRVVGDAYLTAWDDAVPFIWEQDTGLAELPPANTRRTVCSAINAAGTIVGLGQDAFPYNSVACRWAYQGGHQWTLVPLDPLAPWTQAGASGINDSGAIVGSSGDEYTFVACRWDPPNFDAPMELPDLGGPEASWATAINDASQYVGVSSTPDDPPKYRAFFYDGNECINLGVPPGYEDYTSFATRVSNDGTVIGYGHKHDPHWSSGWGDTNARAFVWRHGVLTALKDALVGGAGWTNVYQALDINERGQIAGIGQHNGVWRACRLTPAYGDLNCDGAINAFDIDPFVLALTAPTSYAAAFPDCDILDGDCNGDGLVNVFDIDPFVLILTGG